MRMVRSLVLPTTLLAGTVIGAGIFSLPYVFARVGVLAGAMFLLVFALVYALLNFMYAKMVAAQEGDHQFIFLARRYFSSIWSRLASAVIVGELIFVLVVYLALAPSFFRLFAPFPEWVSLIFFWVLGSLFLFARPGALSIAEFSGTALIIGIVALLWFFAPQENAALPLSGDYSLGALLLPFGPLLFSLSGRPAIPKMVEEWRRSSLNVRYLYRSIIAGSLLPALVYFAFIIAVFSFVPVATPNIVDSFFSLPSWLLASVGAMGVVAVLTSYAVIGINVRDIFLLDAKYSRMFSSAVAALAPLLLYFSGVSDFFETVVFTGSVFLALEGMIIVRLFQKAFPRHAAARFGWFLYPVFFVALAYEVFHFFIG